MRSERVGAERVRAKQVVRCPALCQERLEAVWEGLLGVSVYRVKAWGVGTSGVFAAVCACAVVCVRVRERSHCIPCVRARG